MADDTARKNFELARARYASGDVEDPVFGELASDQYEPAFGLFSEMLDDKNRDVRDRALDYLLSMADVAWPADLLDKLRKLVRTDEDAIVRRQASHALGSHSRWPEPALEHALDNDEDKGVRQQAFLSILELMTSWDFADEQRSRLRSGELKPSMETARKLVAEHEKAK